jgi:hypothetical protein
VTGSTPPKAAALALTTFTCTTTTTIPACCQRASSFSKGRVTVPGAYAQRRSFAHTSYKPLHAQVVAKP